MEASKVGATRIHAPGNRPSQRGFFLKQRRHTNIIHDARKQVARSVHFSIFVTSAHPFGGPLRVIRDHFQVLDLIAFRSGCPLTPDVAAHRIASSFLLPLGITGERWKALAHRASTGRKSSAGEASGDIIRQIQPLFCTPMNFRTWAISASGSWSGTSCWESTVTSGILE